jgi:hypothetical protein
MGPAIAGGLPSVNVWQNHVRLVRSVPSLSKSVKLPLSSIWRMRDVVMKLADGEPLNAVGRAEDWRRDVRGNQHGLRADSGGVDRD